MKFEKVSKKEFVNICKKYMNEGKMANIFSEGFEKDYEDLRIPKQGTKLSAGMDFFAPFSAVIFPDETITKPTRIRWDSSEHADKVLLMVPRSGLGFKTGLRLMNTIGVIDADYCKADNEGHIIVKMYNPSDKPVNIGKGTAFVQGVIVQYYICEGSESDDARNGGFGSTD